MPGVAALAFNILVTRPEKCLTVLYMTGLIKAPYICKAYLSRATVRAHSLEAPDCYHDVGLGSPEALNLVRAADFALHAEEVPQLCLSLVNHPGPLVEDVRREEREHPIRIVRIDPRVVLSNCLFLRWHIN